MRQYWTFLFWCMAVVTVSAQAVDYGKISPWLRLAVEAEYGNGHNSHRAASLQGRDIMAFIQTEDDEVLERHGCRTYARMDDIVIAAIPLSQLAALSRQATVKRIEASQTCHTTMDTVPKVVNVLPAYSITEQHPAFTGKGVVVGVMDVGFDLTHPTFYNDKTLSQYRIKAFWDQLSQDTIGSSFPVGRDFIGQEAILAQGCTTDGREQSHGTHTAGIASGSGFDSPYRGIAFESDICLVANAVTEDTIFINPKDYYKYTSATDALGFKYLFDYADSQGKPCVASFSEGYSPYLDKEDSLFSAFLDKLSGPGHILVVSAGNENQALTYAEKPQGVEKAGAFLSTYKKSAGYRLKSNGPFTIGFYVYNSSGQQLLSHSISSEDERLDSVLNDSLYIGNELCVISITRYPSKFTDDTFYLLRLSAKRNLNEIGYMALTAEGAESHVEIYGSSSNPLRVRTDIDPQWNAAISGHNIFAPACFKTPICVGATTWRTSFTNYQGSQITSGNQSYGKRMTESSTGPAINGLMKPEVTAPGYNVISSYSSYYLEGDNADAWDYYSSVKQFKHNGRTYSWTALSGTSMACPVVAGTIALWLQAKPTLTRDEILDVFRRTCSHPEQDITYPNNDYGYGEIDGYRGLLDILGASSIEGLSIHQPSGVRITANNRQLQLSFAQTPNTEVNIRVYSLSGTLKYQTRLIPTASEVSIPLPIMSEGVYAVQISGSERLTGSQLIRL